MASQLCRRVILLQEGLKILYPKAVYFDARFHTLSLFTSTPHLRRLRLPLTFLQMLGRLGEFEGTCLTLLVRGLAPPPAPVERAISRLPPERFAVTHLPPYNPSFGFVADRLMLSWAVRSAGATAFVSTLHTHPYRVRIFLFCWFK